MTVERATRPIDEDYVADIVRELRKLGFPATEGYYLVVLTPIEARELDARLTARRVFIPRRHEHQPIGLMTTAKNLGYLVGRVLDNALVVVADHANPKVPRRAEKPRHLKLVR